MALFLSFGPAENEGREHRNYLILLLKTLPQDANKIIRDFAQIIAGDSENIFKMFQLLLQHVVLGCRRVEAHALASKLAHLKY